MKRGWFIALVIIGLEGLLLWATYQPGNPNQASSGNADSTPAATAAQATAAQATAPIASPAQNSSSGPVLPAIRYETYALPQATAHVLTLPAGSGLLVKVSSVAGVDSLENFARSGGAIAAINGGFFDPENLLSTSYLVQQGQLTADPKLNDRLMQNPNLAPYLDKILNRSEFRRYQCASTDGNAVRYAITPQNEPVPDGCQIADSLGAGPQLLPALTPEQEGFLATENGAVIRDAIGYSQPKARSAIGLTGQGDVVIAMVAQQPQNPSGSGISLPALAEFMKSLGAVQSLNLDGGGSSSLYYEGKTIFGSVDAEGSPVGRSVKSVLLVVPQR